MELWGRINYGTETGGVLRRSTWKLSGRVDWQVDGDLLLCLFSYLLDLFDNIRTREDFLYENTSPLSHLYFSFPS